jgi:hypothetical protein
MQQRNPTVRQGPPTIATRVTPWTHQQDLAGREQDQVRDSARRGGGACAKAVSVFNTGVDMICGMPQPRRHRMRKQARRGLGYGMGPFWCPGNCQIIRQALWRGPLYRLRGPHGHRRPVAGRREAMGGAPIRACSPISPTYRHRQSLRGVRFRLDVGRRKEDVRRGFHLWWRVVRLLRGRAGVRT